MYFLFRYTRRLILSSVRSVSTLIVLSILMLSHLSSYAQLNANFTMSKDKGCAPLYVTFNNTSTGNQDSCFWDLGINGNTADECNPSAIFIDIQRIPDQNEEGFWLELINAVAAALSANFSVRNIHAPKAKKELTNYEFFQNWLSDINSALQGWKVVIAIDELSVIDELWNPIEAKRLSSRLKAMVESDSNVKFILCVQQTFYLRSLNKSDIHGPATWPLLRTGITMQLDYLDEGAARKLIREPMGQMLHFEDLAVERILFLTSSHPYYLQNFLHEIINFLNTKRENTVTLEVVELISQRILRQELLFYNIRQEYEGFKRYVLSAMASIGGEDCRSMNVKDMQIALQRKGITAYMRGLISTLEDLRDRGVIERDDSSNTIKYSFRVPLICLWLIKNKPINLIFAPKERRRYGVK